MKVAIVLGSTSDQGIFKESGAERVLDDVGIEYTIAIISAHRNHHILVDYCQSAQGEGVKIFIAAAGMAAALPGVIAAICADMDFHPLIIGVPLPSTDFPNCLDSLLSMVRMPPGLPVAVCGIGKSGFKNAAIAACEVLVAGNEIIRRNLATYFRDNTKIAILNGKCLGGKP